MVSNPDLERAVLLRACTDPDWLSDVRLEECDFYAEAHKAILRALRRLASDGAAVDAVTLRVALGAAAKGPAGAALDQVLAGTYSDADTNVDKLRELSECRRFEHAYREGAAKAADGDLGAVRQHVAQLLNERPVDNQFGALLDSPDQMRALAGMFTEGSGDAIHPGCEVVQELIGYLYPGLIYVIGGDTNVGKSSVALEMAEGLADRGVLTGTISFEDSERVFGSRRVARRSGVSSRDIMRRKFHPEDLPAIKEAMHEVADKPLLFAHLRGGTEADAVLTMTRMVKRGARVIFGDYLQAISLSRSTQDRRNEMREVNTALASAAARLNVPLVLCSQLRRPQDKQNGKPSKHDLKESGDIGNAADVILLLWRDVESDVEPIKMWLAKSKYGGVGSDGAYLRDKSGTLRPGKIERNADGSINKVVLASDVDY